MYNQFGFKAKVSSDMCVFTLKQLISSYHKQGSPVYCAFLDASKAFDRVNHYMLFKKLIEKYAYLFCLNFILLV